jgi:UDP-2,3-diacylglucosamine hydrolase
VGRLGIIAGGGDLPRRLAQHAIRDRRAIFVLNLRGFADPALASEFPGAEIALGEIGRGISLLKGAGCDELVFAGWVKRPDLSALKFDMKGAALLPDLIGAASKGDDALLRIVLGAFEKAGFKVVGADDLLASLLAPSGRIAGPAPSGGDWTDIRKAAEAAREIGLKDIGQGAIARGGEVIAMERETGTDAMLLSLAKSADGARRRGVLVKRPKPQQERRIDLPVIGEVTVQGVFEAGLAGVAVEAGGALIIDRERVEQEAQRLNVFVYGFTAAELV